MNDNEIIKAFEKCLENDILQTQCINCDYRKHGNLCMDILFNQILDLINRQQADNERLKKLLEESETKENRLAKQFYKAGVKDLAKRLKDYYINNKRYKRPYAHTVIDYLFDVIDNLANEMVGGTE